MLWPKEISMKVSAGIALFCLPIFVPVARAQAPDNDVDAVAAALPAIMSKVPLGLTAVVYNDKTADLSKRLAVKIGKTIEPEANKLDCRKNSATGSDVCSLKNVASLVNLGGVIVGGETATAFFNIEIPSGSETVPIEHYLYAVDLKRSGAVWTVVRVRSVMMS
jgi:hypothetical protein